MVLLRIRDKQPKRTSIYAFAIAFAGCMKSVLQGHFENPSIPVEDIVLSPAANNLNTNLFLSTQINVNGVNWKT